MRKRIAVIPGEDGGREAMEAALGVLEQMALAADFSFPLAAVPAGADGQAGLSPEARAGIDAADATFFGATDGGSFAALAYLRWGKDAYANVRPTRWWPGCASPLRAPEDIDLVIVRENLEDAYVRLEGDLLDLEPLDLASRPLRRKAHELGPGRYAIKAITEAGSRRIARFAFEIARRRKAAGGPGRVTAGAKWNMLPQSDGLFVEVARAVGADYPDIAFDTLLVDDLAQKLVMAPGRFDVILLPNLYGDILSDAAAALTGGLGVAPSGCYGPDYAYFEPVHGTAPDIAGRGRVNPTATLLAGAMMLEHIGLEPGAQRLRAALGRVYAAGRWLTPDQGGSATTGDFCRALIGEL